MDVFSQGVVAFEGGKCRVDTACMHLERRGCAYMPEKDYFFSDPIPDEWVRFLPDKNVADPSNSAAPKPLYASSTSAGKSWRSSSRGLKGPPQGPRVSPVSPSWPSPVQLMEQPSSPWSTISSSKNASHPSVGLEIAVPETEPPSLESQDSFLSFHIRSVPDLRNATLNLYQITVQLNTLHGIRSQFHRTWVFEYSFSAWRPKSHEGRPFPPTQIVVESEDSFFCCCTEQTLSHFIANIFALEVYAHVKDQPSILGKVEIPLRPLFQGHRKVFDSIYPVRGLEEAAASEAEDPSMSVCLRHAWLSDSCTLDQSCSKVEPFPHIPPTHILELQPGQGYVSASSISEGTCLFLFDQDPRQPCTR